ncbi:four-carbon acid sugar kinase family protein [Lachnoclostridium sp. Marseille-P6806]|uniref:four-carbon acid sugar kinase family protein n=1 Tax=Lachnoclostridium sp. Marseille-P6806 TaxID=2364793 RepID=UPI0013EF2EA3|nr:four-carbon acid sugar kinase family protein [Lachnoclostridium sp. Marseille-P6806]
MIDLLVIADDFTGALDTGVQFASAGIRTIVKINDQIVPEDFQGGERILVVNTRSRHMCPADAYHIVYRLTRCAVKHHVPRIYKKTDSGLRGNIGAELSALLEASGKGYLPFIPAFPKANRITRNGIQYIDGCPVAESVFGRDPFDPVTVSYIPEIIRLQSDVPVHLFCSGSEPEREVPAGIGVYDSQSEAEELEIAKGLYEAGKLEIMAGCAGFAAVLPELLQMKAQAVRAAAYESRILVINSSLNPVTEAQLRAAEQNGFCRISLTAEEKIESDYWETEAGKSKLEEMLDEYRKHSRCIVDGSSSADKAATDQYASEKGLSAHEVQKRIPASLGKVVRVLMGEREAALMVIGGDTLLGILEQLSVESLTPVEEIFPGTVLSVFAWEGRRLQMISKSGGLGHETILAELADWLLQREEVNVADKI